MRMATLVMFLLAFVAMPNAGAGRNVSHVERLSHRSECGNVAVRAGGKRLPGDAKISVTIETSLDEAPEAYKSLDFIRGHITPTGDIVDRLLPIYNFKG